MPKKVNVLLQNNERKCIYIFGQLFMYISHCATEATLQGFRVDPLPSMAFKKSLTSVTNIWRWGWVYQFDVEGHKSPNSRG